MKEIAEFRVLERHAHLLFAPHEGQRLGDSIRRIEMSTADPRLLRVRELQEQLTARGDSFFSGWDLRRNYTPSELAAATTFQVLPRAAFEPAGEDCGTRYTSGCERCGGGSTLIGPLILRRRFPKADFANTIANELVAASRAKEALVANAITGVSFAPVFHGTPPKPSAQWFQIVILSSSANVVFPTETGGSIFDSDEKNEFRCPKGHLLGLNIHSEVYVERRSIGEYDLVETQQFVGPHNIGVRGGSVLRPRRLLLASRRVYELVRAVGLKGWKFEIAREVEDGVADWRRQTG